MKLFTVNKNINGQQNLLTINDILLTCSKAIKSHLAVDIVFPCYKETNDLSI